MFLHSIFTPTETRQVLIDCKKLIVPSPRLMTIYLSIYLLSLCIIVFVRDARKCYLFWIFLYTMSIHVSMGTQASSPKPNTLSSAYGVWFQPVFDALDRTIPLAVVRITENYLNECGQHALIFSCLAGTTCSQATMRWPIYDSKTLAAWNDVYRNQSRLLGELGCSFLYILHIYIYIFINL